MLCWSHMHTDGPQATALKTNYCIYYRPHKDTHTWLSRFFHLQGSTVLQSSATQSWTELHGLLCHHSTSVIPRPHVYHVSIWTHLAWIVSAISSKLGPHRTKTLWIRGIRELLSTFLCLWLGADLGFTNVFNLFITTFLVKIHQSFNPEVLCLCSNILKNKVCLRGNSKNYWKLYISLYVQSWCRFSTETTHATHAENMSILVDRISTWLSLKWLSNNIKLRRKRTGSYGTTESQSKKKNSFRQAGRQAERWTDWQLLWEMDLKNEFRAERYHSTKHYWCHIYWCHNC